MCVSTVYFPESCENIVNILYRQRIFNIYYTISYLPTSNFLLKFALN